MEITPIYCNYLETPAGRLVIEDDGRTLTAVYFACGKEQKKTSFSAVGRECVRQLEEYFSGKRRSFCLPLAVKGTDFERKVWAELARIPYGDTRTYGQIAAAIGCPRAARAVGRACHMNPWVIVVPCHRVVGAGGRLTGYAGGLPRKQFLLQWEKQNH